MTIHRGLVKKRQLIIIVSLLVMISGSFLVMRFLMAQKKEFVQKPPQAGDRYVAATPVEYTTIHSTISGKGRVVSSAEVEIVAEASGKISAGAIPLKKGQSFSRGDVLLTIYKDEMELALKAQKSQFLNTLANLLPDIKIDFPERFQDFRSFFNAIDLDKNLPPLPEIEGEKLKIYLASRNLLSDYYSLLKLEKQLSRHTLYAPFNGTFVRVNLQAGAYTNTGGRIATIIHTDTVEVEIPVENGFTEWIQTGQSVKLFSTDRRHTWTGQVVRISDFVDPNTQTRPVYVSVPLHGQKQLYAGEYLNCEFHGGTIEQAMEIPRKAVFNYDQIFVVQEGKLRQEQIEIIKINEESLVFRGLPEGTRIVVQPLINVSENTPVKILDRDGSPDKL
ncbi:efflux RND transporter periplasmic adaptor subunit [candidate division KSB1 bacterium]|nr:efflux RND transporter periplasmic adaptor subunit [candidate division KSB1 bacterium]